MADYKPLTALQQIAENANLSIDCKGLVRDKKETLTTIDMESFYSGESVGYAHSFEIMAKELQRLKNLFQNGALTIEDFGVY